MGIKVFGDQFWEITPKIEEALDTALAGTLNLQQAAEQAANPKTLGGWHHLGLLGITRRKSCIQSTGADKGLAGCSD